MRVVGEFLACFFLLGAEEATKKNNRRKKKNLQPTSTMIIGDLAPSTPTYSTIAASEAQILARVVT